MLGVIDCTEEESEWAGKPATIWRYSLREGIDSSTLDPESVPEMLVPPYPDPESVPEKLVGSCNEQRGVTNKSGTDLGDDVRPSLKLVDPSFFDEPPCDGPPEDCEACYLKPARRAVAGRFLCGPCAEVAS